MTHYDFSQPPKIIVRFFSMFRKWKLSAYKKRKVREEKSLRNRMYFVKFTVKIEDSINPQESTKEYEMFIPAKAAFFAKRKALDAIRKKITLDFLDCEIVTDEEFEALKESKEQYVASKQ